MTRRAIAHTAAFACATALALMLPALGQASSGGGGMGPGSSGSGFGTSGSQGVTAQPANVAVTASGDGMTIATRASALLRSGLQFTGSVPTSDAGDVIVIERYGPRTDWTWEPTVQATVATNGRFAAVWQTNHIGQFSIRAVIQHAGAATASASPALPTVNVTIYRPSVATLYGPGFWGRTTACGLVLRRGTIGVASPTLPCGTPVAVYYDGRSVVLPVIDRGPYANDADWDLTMAAGRALGIDTTVTLGAVSLPRIGQS